jgi:hypothetical protein
MAMLSRGFEWTSLPVSFQHTKQRATRSRCLFLSVMTALSVLALGQTPDFSAHAQHQPAATISSADGVLTIAPIADPYVVSMRVRIADTSGETVLDSGGSLVEFVPPYDGYYKYEVITVLLTPDPAVEVPSDDEDDPAETVLITSGTFKVVGGRIVQEESSLGPWHDSLRVVRNAWQWMLDMLIPSAHAARLQSSDPVPGVDLDDTTDPANWDLEVPGNNTRFQIQDTNSSGAPIPFIIEKGAPTNTLFLESTGDVGFGTNNPGFPIHILDSTPEIRLEDSSDNTSANIQYSNGGSFSPDGELTLEGNTQQDIVEICATAPASSLTVNCDGFVGLGTSNPQKSLDIRGGGRADIRIENSNAGFFWELNTRNNGRFDVFSEEFGDNVATFSPSGFVGLGTTNPQVFLDIQGGGRADIRMENANAGFFWELNTRNNGRFDVRSQIGGNVATFLPSGRVGIGTTGPVFTLDVAGAAHASSFPTSSDIRLKTNITQLSNVLEKLDKIRGVSFEWNALYESLGRSTGRREIGVIAQEVEAVFPELVTTWGDEAYKAVDYGRLTGVLIEAVKELKAKNEAQDQQIVALEARIAALEQTDRENDAPAQISFSALSAGWPFLVGLSLIAMVLERRRRVGGRN